jgi:hypothetical protein
MEYVEYSLKPYNSTKLVFKRTNATDMKKQLLRLKLYINIF